MSISLSSRRRLSLIALLILWGLIAAPSSADLPIDPAGSIERSTEPVILTGNQFPQWSAGPEISVREPQASNDVQCDGDVDCSRFDQEISRVRTSDCKKGSGEYSDSKDHNCYQEPRLRIAGIKEGAAVTSLLAFKWNGNGFTEIPFQVDERFTRYITNNNSGFAFYSGADKHTTYAYDREGWRFTTNDDSSPCVAKPRDGQATTPDPVVGLDDNDELAFMYSDTAAQAPADASLPAGIVGSHEVRIADPASGSVTFAYVMLSGAGGPSPGFNSSNGYVSFVRDADADQYLYSQSSYEDYGAAPPGAYFDPTSGTCITAAPKQRRPRDTAWVTTPTYRFRYDGRWVMNELRIKDDSTGTFGPDLIDQWKARAFQQRPGGEMPCCGYEEEVNNWGGSSMILGERSGPVRAMREIWGADSATNNIRRETFYRDEIRQQNYLRVHVIPPGDGIYVQWDYNAGAVNKYYNPWRPDGVDIDGRNDEVFGNLYAHVDSDGVRLRDDDPVPIVGPQDVSVGNPSEGPGCAFRECAKNDVDVHDATFSGPHGALNWEEIAGPYGTLVTRWTKLDITAGNGYQATTTPYYRDDSCFDDGTGSNPGPHLNPRKTDSGQFGQWLNPSTGLLQGRECWKPGDDLTGDPALDRRFWQGDIGTHGLHVNLIADSDNAMMTEPVTELTSEYRIVTLKGNPGNVGERYGRSAERPLVITVI